MLVYYMFEQLIFVIDTPTFLYVFSSNSLAKSYTRKSKCQADMEIKVRVKVQKPSLLWLGLQTSRIEQTTHCSLLHCV
jgi:hypothetical protein